MIGPTSLEKRVTPSCCPNEQTFKENCQYRQRNCHRNRRRKKNAETDEGIVGKRSRIAILRSSINAGCCVVAGTGLEPLERDDRERIGNAIGDDEKTKDRVCEPARGEDMDSVTSFHDKYTDGYRTRPEIYDERARKRPRSRSVKRSRRLVQDSRDKRVVRVRDEDYRGVSWRFYFSDPLTRRHGHLDDSIARRHRGGVLTSSVFFLATAGAFLALAIVAPPVSGTSSEKDEASRPRMGGTDAGTTHVSSPPNIREERLPAVDTRTSNIAGTISGVDITGSIDLLATLQLYNTTRTGVTQVPGLASLRPAYYLQGDERDIRLNEASFKYATALLRRVPEFTIAAALRQEKENSGTIVAFSHGNNRYLELQSSGRKDELRLHYVSRHDGAVYVEAFPFRLADGAWHRIALSISGSQVELLVDCHPLYRRLLRPGPPDTNFTLPQLQLWVGQRNAKHFLFKGALQDVKLIPGAHGYLTQCPQLDTSCPTCGQFSILQNTVDQLMHNLNELTRRLAAAEGRISQVEECECQKSCRANGTVHEDGATWKEGCEQCSCVHGDITCRPVLCAPVSCKYPVIPEGECCPVCLRQCYLHEMMYDHGEIISPKQCTECNCDDGVFTCKRFDVKVKCPPLPCPASEQISVPEECCKFCPDVDECKQEGGSDGHHCNANTRCVNVVGSYKCECLSGYERLDKFNCVELNECATGRHTCSEHATCTNTVGSYYCACNDGYEGDGYTCKPVCEQSCQNGGECVAPGRCSCRRGYIGNSCELDLDECASDLHRCHHSSTCFNMPGWYYCRCKPGYRSALHESNQGTRCLDIDECNDQTTERRHTCHPSARCVNTEGGYECTCSGRDEKRAGVDISGDLRDVSSRNECRLSCWYEGREIENGENFALAANSCRRCECKNGVVSCREPVCDCTVPGSRRDKCCPQCDPAASCRHQELHHLVFRSGERWIYQCQTCECLYGEIDCWEMECPPVTCSNSVTEDGDCCPRCEDDPCARELPGLPGASAVSTTVGHNGSSAYMSLSAGRPQPCSYAGFLHESGSSWQDLHDKCTTCECKDGRLCCSYDYRCAGDLENERNLSFTSDESRAAALSGSANIVLPSGNASKAAISTALPRLGIGTGSSGIVGKGKISRIVAGRTRANTIDEARRENEEQAERYGLFTGIVFANTLSPISGAEGATRELIGATEKPQLSSLFSSTGEEIHEISRRTTNGRDIYEGDSNDHNDPEYNSRDEVNETFGNVKRGSTIRGGSKIPAGMATKATGAPATTTTTATAATATTNAPMTRTTPTAKATTTIATSGTAPPAANSFRSFRNLQTARYSTSRNSNDRKANFASNRRRRPERGPRLVNGNPTGHDAT